LKEKAEAEAEEEEEEEEEVGAEYPALPSISHTLSSGPVKSLALAAIG
jgi:hypothetical protein